MSTTYPRQLPLLGNSHAVQGSTHMTAVWGRTRNHDLPVVLTMGGWPGTTPFQVGLTAASQMPLIAAGYTIITPWAGANWGHPTTASAPSSGPAGTGLTAMDDAITWATAQGLNATTVHIYGTSMGGLNSIAWAKDNASTVGGIFLLAPVLDIMHIYDVAGDSIPPYGTAPDYVPSIHTAWSTASRAATVTATSPTRACSRSGHGRRSTPPETTTSSARTRSRTSLTPPEPTSPGPPGWARPAAVTSCSPSLTPGTSSSPSAPSPPGSPDACR
jgi:hypothetical protein